MTRVSEPADPGSNPRRPPDVEQSTEELKRKAADSLDEARARGEQKLEEKLDQGRVSASDRAERVASAMQRTAEQLDQQGEGTLAAYADEISRSVQNLANNLRSRSVSDLADQMEDLARRSPATFLLGSVAVGLALGRFMKASSRRVHREPDVERAPTPPPENPLFNEPSQPTGP
ncbi:MAG TPA: hypothetical protein VIL32_11740 [Steroidobacteraceae bacterium]